MALFYYDSEHVGAPQLYVSPAGALTNILDACLVGTSGIAYGSTASMGWTMEYSATNQRSYRMPTAGTSGFYVQVIDTAVTASATVLFRGYEAMSDITTGTAPFPTVAQLATLVTDKGSNTQNINRKWALWSNGKIFHLYIDCNYEWSTSDMIFSGKLLTFGDITSYATSDPYKCCLVGYTAGGSTNYPIALSASATSSAAFIARNWQGTGASIPTVLNPQHHAHRFIDVDNIIKGGSMFFSRVYVTDLVGSVRTLRGHIPGLYWVLNDSSLGIRSFIPITTLSGKVLKSVGVYNSWTLAIESSDTWS